MNLPEQFQCKLIVRAVAWALHRQQQDALLAVKRRARAAYLKATAYAPR